MKRLLAGALALGVSTACAASGWFVKVDGNYPAHSACNVLIDSRGEPDACTHRLSVMCLSNGVGSVGGASSYNAPVTLPRTFALYSSPYGLPVGSITVVAVPEGANATMGLNGALPTPDWVPAASYTGAACSTQTIRKR